MADTSIPFARQILMHEASSIQSIAELLDARFDAAVTLLLDLPASGRIIVMGIGKTGIIGEKISATLASVGFPSFVVHPTEAAHGDLGRITSHDVVLLLSNNGATPELIRLLPSFEKLGCKIIAVSSNSDSPLAHYATVFLPMPKIEEAGPLGLAPTASTVALLALGDALVMSALSRRHFSADQFASRHPGGLLGKTLLRVEDIMRRGDQLCLVREQMLCREVLHQITLTRGRPGCSGIIRSDGTLCGVFTDGDLRRCLDRAPDFLSKPISEFMSRTPKTITARALVADALKVLNQFQIDQLLVVDEQNRPIGLLDIQDIVQVG